jgi:hypothetical protein
MDFQRVYDNSNIKNVSRIYKILILIQLLLEISIIILLLDLW